MASSAAFKKHPSCALCMKDHQGSHVLTCHHTLCFSCVEDMSNHSVQCPLCKQPTDVETKLKDKQKEIKELHGSIGEKLLGVTKEIEQIQISEEEVISDLRKDKEEMIVKLESHHNNMEQVIKGNNKMLLERLDQQRKICDEIKKEIESSVAFSADAAESKHAEKLMEAAHHLQCQLNDRMYHFSSPLSSPRSMSRMDYVGQKPAKCVDFSLLINKTFRKLESMEFVGHCPYQMHRSDGNILMAVDNDGIKIYDKEFHLIHHVSNDKLQGCHGVTKTHTGDIIVACYQKGLHQVSTEGIYKGCITEGQFSDVYHYGEKLYAMEYVIKAILIFINIENNWVNIRKVPLKHSKGQYYDKLVVNNTGVYVTSRVDHCLYKYTSDLEFLLWKTGTEGSDEAGKLKNPNICDVDEAGNVLVCDYSNKRLQIYNQEKGEWVIPNIGGKLENCPYTAVLDAPKQLLWVTTGSHIIKFSVAN